jgi:uncharacterized protein (TIGR03437 family)
MRFTTVGVNALQQILVQRNASLGIPEQVAVSQAEPAIFTKDNSGKGQGRIYGVGPDGSTILAEPNTPVGAGDEILVQATGLGAVDPLTPAGSAARFGWYAATSQKPATRCWRASAVTHE